MGLGFRKQHSSETATEGSIGCTLLTIKSLPYKEHQRTSQVAVRDVLYAIYDGLSCPDDSYTDYQGLKLGCKPSYNRLLLLGTVNNQAYLEKP